MDTTPLASSTASHVPNPLDLKKAIYSNEPTLYLILAIFAGIFWLAIILGTLGIALVYLLVFFLIYLFSHSAFISYLKGNAVEISPEQFPDLYRRLLECCQKLEMMHPPKAYLMASDGVLNALATRFLWRDYVVLYSSIVDALETKPDGLNFYIGHELGHLRRNHLGKGPFIAPVAWLPLIGPAYARACEYTCDLHGLRCCDNAEDAANALAVLCAGGEQWKKLNHQRYLKQVQDTSGFWMSFHELANDYPWLSKRMSHVQSIAQGTAYNPPGRNPFAYLFALMTPRTFGAAGGVIVFMVILGVLAAVSLPAYNDYLGRGILSGLSSEDSESQYSGSSDEAASAESVNLGDPELSQVELAAQVASIQPTLDAVLAYYQTNQQWPTTLDELTLLESTDNTPALTLYESGILGFNGPESMGDYQYYWIYLEPRLNEQTNQHEWVCYSPDIPDSYLPPNCQG